MAFIPNNLSLTQTPQCYSQKKLLVILVKDKESDREANIGFDF